MVFSKHTFHFSRRWHKRLSWIVGIQLAIWVIGGAFFAIVPFQGVIKGKDVVKVPEAATISEFVFSYPVSKIMETYPDASQITTQAKYNQGVYVVSLPTGKTFLNSETGSEIVIKPSKEDIIKSANQHYIGDAKITSVKIITEPKIRLGIVDELFGKTGLWQVSFDDTWNSRLYFSAENGEFYRVRNDAWVMYDFFFRLHVMDYNTGEDFNNNLLRAFSIMSIFVTITGIIMLIYSVRSRRKAVRLSQA